MPKIMNEVARTMRPLTKEEWDMVVSGLRGWEDNMNFGDDESFWKRVLALASEIEDSQT